MTIHFHDVSNFQPGYVPTGPTIAKATEGTDFTDWTFASNRSKTLAGGWPFLGYHFLRSGSIAAQVAHAQAVIGADQPLMLDVELAGDGSFPSYSEVQEFMDLHGKVTLVYLPRWFWSGHWGSPGLNSIASRGAGLISSDYTTYSDTGPGWNPYGGMTPIIWQHTATPLDTNAFQGTQDQLAAVFSGGDGMSETTAQQVDDIAWCVDAILNMRDHLVGGQYKGAPTPVVAAIKALQADVAAIKAELAASTGSGLTQAQVDARIAASTLTPPPAQ